LRVEDVLVELGVLVFVLGLSHGDCGARVLVQHAGDGVWYHIAPFHFFAHRYHIVLDDFQDGLDVELGIFQETDEQFKGAVSGAPADAVQ